MNGPLIGTDRAKTIEGQVGALTDAHAGVAEQQEDVSTQIVAAQELLAQTLILLGGERPWQGMW
jgi:DNA-binding FrmR family transcriptional regulator